MVEVKFCGMTRALDAEQAVALGARYVGVILTDSPRRLGVAAARKLLESLPEGIARVGVFGAAEPAQVAEQGAAAGLHVVQLHGDPTPQVVAAVRLRWSGQIWAVQRLSGSALPPGISDLFDVADAVVLDARVPGTLGGTGVALPWRLLRDQIAPLRHRRARLVLAGGLAPANVSSAIEELHPDVVDVSSGVESSVGVKDHALMAAFRNAARTAGAAA